METQTKYFNSDIGNDEGEWANTYNNNRHSFSTSITSPSTSSSPWFKQQKQRHSKTSPCSVMEPPNTSLTRSFSSMSDSQLMHPNSSTSIDEEPFDCSRQLYKKSYSSLSVISSQNRNGIHCKKNNNNNNNNNNTSSNINSPDAVEWMYAFDIHANSYFPLFIILYVLQYPLLQLLLTNTFFAFFLSNLLYTIAFTYYFYITHLGYRMYKPDLINTQVFLFPIALVVFVFILNLVGYPFGLGWNASRIMAHLYFEQ
mmetsp:Transcript_12377/g.15275  ORF Transcript_12377/g.15275 Transcript_12377/m.15275 type:complete len:256 (+) Transcript_12377:204-971(+)